MHSARCTVRSPHSSARLQLAATFPTKGKAFGRLHSPMTKGTVLFVIQAYWERPSSTTVKAAAVPPRRHDRRFGLRDRSRRPLNAVIYSLLYYPPRSELGISSVTSHIRVPFPCIKAIGQVLLRNVFFVFQIHEIIAEQLLCIDYRSVAVCNGVNKSVILV